MTIVSALFLIVSLFGGSAVASYTGPGAQACSQTVDDILKAPQNDQDVVLQGNLIRKVGDEKYIFSDGTGEISVEIDDDKLPPEPKSRFPARSRTIT